MTLTALVFVLAGIDLIKTRLPFNDVVCSEIATDAYYYVPQSKNYELVERYKCENRSNSSIRNFAPVQDGYFEEIPNWTVQYKLLGRTPIGLVVRTQGRPERRTNYFAGGERIFYLYRASAEFEPPLPSGAGFDLVYKLAAGGVPVEAAAFTNNGTLFARGVEYDTLKFHVTIHAPPGFEVRLRDWGVIDPSGRLEADETRRQPEPTITGSGGLLQWRVSLARRHLRYMLRYAFEAYGLQ